MAIALGGDGTLLKVAAQVGRSATPILGVNMGRLGYLSSVMPDELPSAIDSLLSGDYTIEQHSVIEAEGQTALNEIAILKRDTAAMISIRVTINGEYVASYQADGLIVATPTGSTAYNLSNGGPIIAAGTDALCLTPVAPHSMTLRPIVVDGNAEIALSVESRSQNFLLAVDGRSTTMKQGTTITVRKAAHTVNMVKLQGKSYFDTLREKMMWGADIRA